MPVGMTQGAGTSHHGVQHCAVLPFLPHAGHVADPLLVLEDLDGRGGQHAGTLRQRGILFDVDLHQAHLGLADGGHRERDGMGAQAWLDE